MLFKLCLGVVKEHVLPVRQGQGGCLKSRHTTRTACGYGYLGNGITKGLASEPHLVENSSECLLHPCSDARGLHSWQGAASNSAAGKQCHIAAARNQGQIYAVSHMSTAQARSRAWLHGSQTDAAVKFTINPIITFHHAGAVDRPTCCVVAILICSFHTMLMSIQMNVTLHKRSTATFLTCQLPTNIVLQQSYPVDDYLMQFIISPIQKVAASAT